MSIPTFSGDEDKDGNNPKEWLRKKRRQYEYSDEASKWRKSFDKDIKLYSKWEEFEKLFSNKWIKEQKNEAVSKIQHQLK